jgi:hypothetical protein
MGLFVNLDKDTLSNTRWNNRYWSDIVYDDGHGSGLAWTFSFGKVQQMDQQ